MRGKTVLSAAAVAALVSGTVAGAVGPASAAPNPTCRVAGEP